MLNSKELIEQTGISRATLNNYIGWGIVPKPEVLPPGPQDGDAPRLGYFPDDTVARVEEIQRLKKQGLSMARIAEYFGAKPSEPPPAEDLAAGPPSGFGELAGAAAARTEDEAADGSGPASSLAGRRTPALTEVAVLVADLHHSNRIWTALPPDEYFELISHIWSTVEPIFRRYAARHGKHPADGIVGYFLPLLGTSYLWNALRAAHEMRSAMRRVSKDWQLRKGWSTELYMNIGIDEGREWLGSFRSGTTVEFAALASTLNQAVRISDFSRYGAIWATKNLIGKLSPEERQRLKYGVRRKTPDGQHTFIPSVFSSVHPVTRSATGSGDRLAEFGQLPITEIVDIQADKFH